jgi:hypothetical protein
MKADFHDSLGRIGAIATIDVVGTAPVAFCFARLLGWNPWRTIALAFVLGEMVQLARRPMGGQGFDRNFYYWGRNGNR